MTILAGKQAANWEDAANLVKLESEDEEISLQTMEMFNAMVDRDKLHGEALRAIDKALYHRYPGRKPVWHGPWWYIPAPHPGFDSREAPRLEFVIPIYLVASLRVEANRNIYSLTLIEILGKPESLVLPLLFLQSLISNNLDWIKVIARRPGETIWEIPGLKPIPLSDEFLKSLKETLQRLPLVDWLRSFGDPGYKIAPLASGSMLAVLLAHRKSSPVAVEQQNCTFELLVSALESMAYTVTEAQAMVQKTLPDLKPEMNLEEGLKIVLQVAGKGG